MPLRDLTSEIVEIPPSSFGLVLGPTPTDPTEISQLTEKIRRHRHAELERPLAVTRKPFSDFEDTLLVPRREMPSGGRELPAFLRGGGDHECTLKLIEPIRHASQAVSSHKILDKVEGEYSRIWKARLIPVDNSTGGEVVVLKIFQQSAMPLPAADKNPFQDFLFANEAADVECRAYHKLLDLQGLIIPYNFGTYKMIMPHNEEAYVLMLEYIQGETLVQWLSRLPNADELGEEFTEHLESYERVVTSCLQTMNALHWHNVAHGSPLGQNIMITTSTPGSGSSILPLNIDDQRFSVIFIDFGDCRFLECFEAKERAQVKKRDKDWLANDLLCCTSHDRILCKIATEQGIEM
ncbi:hypothetical protein CPB85DRAFT_1331720 [Mucidula mucida]|nr:hypothetical protein CPB85DRAFT_1331720 [Mucidula mucida]